MFFSNSKKLREIDKKIDMLQDSLSRQNESMKASFDLIQSMLEQYRQNENSQILELKASLFDVLNQQRLSNQNSIDELRTDISEQLRAIEEKNAGQIDSLSARLEHYNREMKIADKQYNEECITAIKNGIEAVDIRSLLEQYTKSEQASITAVEDKLVNLLLRQEHSQQDSLNELEKGIQLLLMNSVMDLIPTEN